MTARAGRIVASAVLVLGDEVHWVEEDEDKRQSFWRAPEFWLLLAASGVSTLGVTGWIVIPLALVGLSISSLPKYIELRPRAERVGAQAEWWKTVGLSVLNNLAAAVGAFVLGNLVRWLSR